MNPECEVFKLEGILLQISRRYKEIKKYYSIIILNRMINKWMQRRCVWTETSMVGSTVQKQHNKKTTWEVFLLSLSLYCINPHTGRNINNALIRYRDNSICMYKDRCLVVARLAPYTDYPIQNIKVCCKGIILLCSVQQNVTFFLLYIMSVSINIMILLDL